jgi:DNA-binding transcriptional ArsR family regulator
MNETQAIDALAALAHDARLRIFRLLVEAGPAGVSAGAVAERLGIVPATLTFHLNHLRHAGLVTGRRTGRSIIYAAEFAAMTGLVAYLTENCCGRSQAACAPQAGCTSQTAAPSLALKEPSHETPARARRR